MDQEEFVKIQRKLSIVNELRNKFWEEYRSLRNEFLQKYPIESYKGVPEWQNIKDTLDDMYESGVLEGMKRRVGKPPIRVTLNPLDTLDENSFEASFEEFTKGKEHGISTGLYERRATGLHESNKLCPVCGRPVVGSKRKKYCCDQCRGIEKSRKFRKEYPGKKALSNLKYLQNYPPEE